MKSIVVIAVYIYTTLVELVADENGGLQTQSISILLHLLQRWHTHLYPFPDYVCFGVSKRRILRFDTFGYPPNSSINPIRNYSQFIKKEGKSLFVLLQY